MNTVLVVIALLCVFGVGACCGGLVCAYWYGGSMGKEIKAKLEREARERRGL